VQVGNMSEHVVAMNHVRASICRSQLSANAASKKRLSVWMPFSLRHPGNVARRFNAEHGYAVRHVVLEQIPVIAGDFAGEAGAAQPPRGDHALGDGARVFAAQSPKMTRNRDSCRKESPVNSLRDLHQRTRRAEDDFQRIGRFRLAELRRGQERIRQRHLPQVENRLKVVMAADSAEFD
jgi:hypothetical protein